MVVVEENKLRQEFDQNGYVIFRNFFSETEVKDLLADIQASRIEGEFDSADSLTKGDLRFHMNMFKRSKAIQSFIAQPKNVDLLSKLIGPNFWVRWIKPLPKTLERGYFPGIKTIVIAA